MRDGQQAPWDDEDMWLEGALAASNWTTPVRVSTKSACRNNMPSDAQSADDGVQQLSHRMETVLHVVRDQSLEGRAVYGETCECSSTTTSEIDSEIGQVVRVTGVIDGAKVEEPCVDQPRVPWEMDDHWLESLPEDELDKVVLPSAV